MGYKEHLAEACNKVRGAYACTVMGYDGILVDTHETGQTDVDVNGILVEYAGIVGKLAKTGDYLATGGVRDFSVSAEDICVMMRPLSEEYFLALVTKGDANAGKARFMLRVLAPKIRRELLDT